MNSLDLIIKIENHININDNSCNSGLMMGYSGICLFYHKLYKITKIKGYYLKFEYYLEKVYSSINNDILTFDIKDGLSGIVWLFQYLEKNDKSVIIDIDFYEDANNLMKSSFYSSLKENNWEYMRGALGCLHVIDDEELYNDLFDYIERFIDKHDELYSKFYSINTNLGLPFGISAILYFCNKALKYQKLQIKSTKIRNTIISIIAKNEQIENGITYYPALSGQIEKCRLAWCYGELTIAYQLLITSEYYNDIDLRNRAIQIAKYSTIRYSLNDTMINDACLQHGAIGNYILYKLFHQKTNDLTFKIAAKNWKDEAVNMLNSNNFLSVNRYTTELYKNDSLLEGLSGIGLALMDYTYEDDWLSSILLK